MPSTPILKALTRAGVGPRRSMADAIRSGRVEVNGEVIEDFGHPVDTDMDHILIDKCPIELKPPKLVYLLLHKPRGVLTTTRDDRGRKTVLDILPTKYRQPGLHPIGRLDKDSTGLLLLTNDGDLTHRLAHPRFKHEKEYLISIRARLNPAEKRRLERGIELEDGTTLVAKVKEVHSKPFNYSITLHEGRKRQVRRMFKHLGFEVLALRRIRVGNVLLGDLPEGKLRELTSQEASELII
ncbi:MAG: rRNA pseudouridine synthase [Dehalococcoidia bacterium]|nr:MAG: rRNA pseudouridine synthase [Dehalococcoidia bacterium]